MIQRIQRRLHGVKDEEGFTLIELMVVVLIIAILIAIAIPTFLGARKRAQDRAAQSSLRNTVTAAKAIFTDEEDYIPATPAELTNEEPSLTFVDSPADSTRNTAVSVEENPSGAVPPAKSTRFVAAVWADSNVCWFIQDESSGAAAAVNRGTRWARLDTLATSTGCNAAAAPANLAPAGATPAAGEWARTPGEAVSTP